MHETRTTDAPNCSSAASVSAPAVPGGLATREVTQARRVSVTLSAVLYLAMLPVTMMVPVLREFVAERFNASSFWTHSFMSVNMIGAVLIVPLGGTLADSVSRRKPILVAALLADAALIAAMSLVTSLPALLLVRFVEGAAHLLAVSTVMAMGADWAPPTQRGRSMGLLGAMLILGTACGAPLGGYVGRAAATAVLHLGAAMALTAALLAALGTNDATPTQDGARRHPRRSPTLRGAKYGALADPSRRFQPARRTQEAPLMSPREMNPADRASSGRRPARLRDAWNIVRTCPGMLITYAYAFIDRFCVGVIVSTFVLFLATVHGLDPHRRGVLLALFLFPFALLCYPVGRLTDSFGRVLPMCAGSLAFGVVYALYGFLPVHWLPPAMVASGVLSAVMFAPNLALCSDLAPPDHRATAYAGFNVAGSLGFLCGPLVGGAVFGWVAAHETDLGAYRAAFVVAGATEVLCASITLPWLLDLRRSSRTR